jgi:hypothetical protein
VLLLATVALTGCRFAEHSRRAAIDAFASFVLDSVSRAPLTQTAPATVSRGQASVPVLAAAVPPPAAPARPECLTSIRIELPTPQPRIASIDLAPAAAAVARVNRFVVCSEAARARVEARMTLAELRGGGRPERVRRIVVVVPDFAAPEVPPTPATL